MKKFSKKYCVLAMLIFVDLLYYIWLYNELMPNPIINLFAIDNISIIFLLALNLIVVGIIILYDIRNEFDLELKVINTMNREEFKDMIVQRLKEIIMTNPLNAHQIDIGITSKQLVDMAVDIIINHHPYIIDKSFYTIKDRKTRDRYRKLLKRFDIDFYFILRDNFIDLIEGGYWEKLFLDNLEKSTHNIMKEISKMITRLFND